MNRKTFKLDIITPTRVLFSDQVTHVKAPGIVGCFGVLARHTPFLTALKIGEIEVNKEESVLRFATSGGFVEVGNNTMTILAETAELATEIDLPRAQAAKERALKRLQERHPDTQFDRARLALFRALNRITIAQKN